MIVLCLDDFPLGIYSTEALADAAALTDWKRREPNWERFGLTVGQGCYHEWTEQPVRFLKYHYHQHDFVVDAEAQS